MFVDKKTSIKIWTVLILLCWMIFEEPGSNVLSRQMHGVLSY